MNLNFHVYDDCALVVFISRQEEKHTFSLIFNENGTLEGLSEGVFNRVKFREV